MRARVLCCVLLAACQGHGVLEVLAGDTGPTATTSPAGTGSGPTTGTATGACGEVRTWAITVEGAVLDASGLPAPFAAVRLEDRGWNPQVTVMGSGTADAAGLFSFAVPELIDVEDCWGTVLNYVLVGEAGPQSGERGVNGSLYGAILDGTLIADVGELDLTAR